MTSIELDEFWRERIVKVWVVNLDGGSRTNPKKDRLIVRSKTREGAIRTAKYHTFSFPRGNCRGRARLADPVFDLGCQSVKMPFWKCTNNLTEKGRADLMAVV